MTDRGGILGLGIGDNWFWIIIAIIVVVLLLDNDKKCCRTDYDYKN